MRKSMLFFSIGIFIFSFFSSGCNAQSIEEQKEKIQSRDKKVLQLEKKRRIMKEDARIFIEEMNVIERNLRSLDYKVYTLSHQVKDCKKNILLFEQQIKARRQSLGELMRMQYVRGEACNDKGNPLRTLWSFFRSCYYKQKKIHQEIKEYTMYMTNLTEDKKLLAYQLGKLHKEKQQMDEMYQELEKKQSQCQDNFIIAKVDQLEKENKKEQAVVFEQIKKKVNEEIERNNGFSRQEVSFLWPVEGGRVTSHFGYRFDPIKKVRLLHRGTDIGAPFGSPIKAVADGRVIESRPSKGYGYIVVLYHGKGVITLYAHMYGSTVKVRVGDMIQRGQVIALVGSNGWSTGPHTHIEVLEHGVVRNLMNYFTGFTRR